MLTKRPEAEIRAAQAVKNNQDFIYATNVALNSIRDEIQKLHLEVRQEKADRENQFQTLKIELENAQDGVMFDMASFDAIQSDFEKRLNKADFEISRLTNLYKTVLDVNEQMHKSFDSIKSSSYEQSKLYAILVQLTKNQSEDFQRRMNVCTERLRDELRVVKPLIDPLEVKLNEQIDIMKNDHRGLYKEISLIKKDVEYGEKKFEAIFTRIGIKKAGE